MGSQAANYIPPAAARQAAEADRLHRQIYGAAEGTEQPAESAAPQEPTAPPEGETPPQQVTASAPEAPAQNQQEAQPSPAPKTEDWEAKYKTLKGKYNKEIPQLQSTLREQTQQLANLQNIIASMEVAAQQQAAQQQQQTQQAPRASTGKLVTETDVEEFGEETIDLIRRAAREESEATINALNKRIAELEGQLTGTVRAVQQTERQKMYAQLDERVSNWREINRDEGFLSWLQQADPYSGVRRHALLTKAFEDNDTARVVRFFEGFLNEHAVVSEQSPAHDSTRQPQVNMETLVAPGRPKNASVRAQEGKRIWTNAEIKQFYRDVQNRRFANRDKERARIEADIIAAGREGRIQA